MSAVNIMFFPAILVSTLALFSYFIPVNNIVRIQFTTTLLLTLIMLLLMVNRFLPITNEFPFIEQIFLGLISIVFSVDFFVIMIQFYQRQYIVWKENQKKKKVQKFQTKVNHRMSFILDVISVTNKIQTAGQKKNERGQKKEEESDKDLASIASISETDESDEEDIGGSQQEIVKPKVTVPKPLPGTRCRRLCDFLIKPENLDHMFFLFMTIGFIVFVVYYVLIYYALWEAIQ